MSLIHSRNRLLSILELDRIWSAYALADLDPKEDENSQWFYRNDAVLLVYAGLEPPVLFATGKPAELEDLLETIPQGRYVYTLPHACRILLAKRATSMTEQAMWRMALDPTQFNPTTTSEVEWLDLEDIPRIVALFAEEPDQPDSFHVNQLLNGPFYGVRHGEELVCIAGTHIVSSWASVAAIGNVFTRPDLRGRGFATMASAAVVTDLLEQGIRTVVLNVAKDNQPAIRCYRRLGFHPHCEYIEGVCELGPA